MVSRSHNRGGGINVISYGSEAKVLNCQVPESYIKDVVFSNVREAGPQS